MFNRKLMAMGAAAMACNLAGCAGQQERLVREQEEHDAECRKFGAEIGTPTYLDCSVALRAIDTMQLGALSKSMPAPWQWARALEREGGRQEEREEWTSETGCSRINAGQLIVFDCGLDTPLAELLAGPDQ